MRRILALAYGVTSYLIFLGAFLYAIGFVGNLIVPKSLDSGMGGPNVFARLIVSVLLVLFAILHSVMARPAFKRAWTKLVPPPIERSTYVLVSSLLLGLLFWQWRPIPSTVWHVGNPAGRWLLHAVFWLGWAIVLLSTFLIDHFDLFGLRQVYFLAVGLPYRPLEFKTVGFYRYVRHPVMTGFLIAFWAAPEMSVGHLLFAALTTAYILIALRFEERDLEGYFGEPSRAYRRSVGLLVPLPGLKKRGRTPTGSDRGRFPIR
jgi:protein-S-isoprenylcysteine O-methyltransferase Ste14